MHHLLAAESGVDRLQVVWRQAALGAYGEEKLWGVSGPLGAVIAYVFLHHRSAVLPQHLHRVAEDDALRR